MLQSASCTRQTPILRWAQTNAPPAADKRGGSVVMSDSAHASLCTVKAQTSEWVDNKQNSLLRGGRVWHGLSSLFGTLPQTWQSVREFSCSCCAEHSTYLTRYWCMSKVSHTALVQLDRKIFTKTHKKLKKDVIHNFIHVISMFLKCHINCTNIRK